MVSARTAAGFVLIRGTERIDFDAAGNELARERTERPPGRLWDATPGAPHGVYPNGLRVSALGGTSSGSVVRRNSYDDDVAEFGEGLVVRGKYRIDPSEAALRLACIIHPMPRGVAQA
jgi:hypothetical protein